MWQRASFSASVCNHVGDHHFLAIPAGKVTQQFQHRHRTECVHSHWRVARPKHCLHPSLHSRHVGKRSGQDLKPAARCEEQVARPPQARRSAASAHRECNTRQQASKRAACQGEVRCFALCVTRRRTEATKPAGIFGLQRSRKSGLPRTGWQGRGLTLAMSRAVSLERRRRAHVLLQRTWLLGRPLRFDLQASCCGSLVAGLPVWLHKWSAAGCGQAGQRCL